jgi:hypothetical protein
MEKEKQTGLVHDQRLGKGHRHAHKTGQRLSQGVVPPLDVSRFSRLFADSKVLLLWDHTRIDLQKVGEAVALPIALYNGLPQALTRLFDPIAHGRRDHLSRLAAEGNPNPGVVRFLEHKRPQFVQFQDRGRGIFGIRGKQGRTQRRKLSFFF